MTNHLISPEKLRQWLADGDAVLIDVRTPEENATRGISCSHLIPLHSLSLSSISGFKGKKIVFHCQVGRRSGRACEAMHALEPGGDFFTLEGGLDNWIAHGFE